jgi:hypothetical protein
MLAKCGKKSGEESCGPAVDGGIRGLPPSTLRQISCVVGRRTLRRMPWGDSTGRDRVMGLALAQMWAQARLMGVVGGGNQLVREYLYATCETRP